MAGQLSFLEEVVMNDLDNYGLKKSDMSCFRAKDPGNNNYNILENIWYGINNIEIPHEMLVMMNTSEILALYAGIGMIKRHCGAIIKKRKTITLKDLEAMLVKENKPIEDVLPILYGAGYGCKAMATMKGRGFTRHSSYPGSLKSRIRNLSPNIKKSFIDSLFSPTKLSNKDNREHFDFYDPNCFGEPDGVGKGLYIGAIFNEIKHIYEANTKK